MRKATKKVKDLKPIDITKSKLVRYCATVDCGNTLAPAKKKFCSAVCKNLFMSNMNRVDNQNDKYKPEFATTKLDEYLNTCIGASKPELIPTSTSFIIMQDAILPTQEDYADFVGVDPRTFLNWAVKHSKFAVAMDKLMRIQKKYLINNTLSKRFDSGMAKLMLNVNHGMIEKQHVDTTHTMIGLVRHIYEGANKIHDQDNEQLG